MLTKPAANSGIKNGPSSTAGGSLPYFATSSTLRGIISRNPLKKMKPPPETQNEQNG
jgi:hypothetical protein